MVARAGRGRGRGAARCSASRANGSIEGVRVDRDDSAREASRSPDRSRAFAASVPMSAAPAPRASPGQRSTRLVRCDPRDQSSSAATTGYATRKPRRRRDQNGSACATPPTNVAIPVISPRVSALPRPSSSRHRSSPRTAQSRSPRPARRPCATSSAAREPDTYAAAKIGAQRRDRAVDQPDQRGLDDAQLQAARVGA